MEPSEPSASSSALPATPPRKLSLNADTSGGCGEGDRHEVRINIKNSNGKKSAERRARRNPTPAHVLSGLNRAAIRSKLQQRPDYSKFIVTSGSPSKPSRLPVPKRNQPPPLPPPQIKFVPQKKEKLGLSQKIFGKTLFKKPAKEPPVPTSYQTPRDRGKFSSPEPLPGRDGDGYLLNSSDSGSQHPTDYGSMSLSSSVKEVLSSGRKSITRSIRKGLQQTGLIAQDDEEASILEFERRETRWKENIVLWVISVFLVVYNTTRILRWWNEFWSHHPRHYSRHTDPWRNGSLR